MSQPRMLRVLRPLASSSITAAIGRLVFVQSICQDWMSRAARKVHPLNIGSERNHSIEFRKRRNTIIRPTPPPRGRCCGSWPGRPRTASPRTYWPVRSGNRSWPRRWAACPPSMITLSVDTVAVNRLVQAVTAHPHRQPADSTRRSCAASKSPRTDRDRSDRTPHRHSTCPGRGTDAARARRERLVPLVGRLDDAPHTGGAGLGCLDVAVGRVVATGSLPIFRRGS